MKKEEKKAKADALHQELEGAKTVFLSSFEGLTVGADTELRRQVRVLLLGPSQVLQEPHPLVEGVRDRLG